MGVPLGAEKRMLSGGRDWPLQLGFGSESCGSRGTQGTSGPRAPQSLVATRLGTGKITGMLEPQLSVGLPSCWNCCSLPSRTMDPLLQRNTGEACGIIAQVSMYIPTYRPKTVQIHDFTFQDMGRSVRLQKERCPRWEASLHKHCRGWTGMRASVPSARHEGYPTFDCIDRRTKVSFQEHNESPSATE